MRHLRVCDGIGLLFGETIAGRVVGIKRKLACFLGRALVAGKFLYPERLGDLGTDGR